MSLRTRIRTLAIGGLILYAILRFIFVREVFTGYGVNAWLFLFIDCLTAVFYVLGIEYLAVSLKADTRSWPKLLLWSAITLISFAAPYVYVFISSKQLPAGLGIGIGVVASLLLLNALLALKKRIRRSK